MEFSVKNYKYMSFVFLLWHVLNDMYKVDVVESVKNVYLCTNCVLSWLQCKWWGNKYDGHESDKK